VARRGFERPSQVLHATLDFAWVHGGKAQLQTFLAG
jgi:hypothetical protein